MSAETCNDAYARCRKSQLFLDLQTLRSTMHTASHLRSAYNHRRSDDHEHLSTWVRKTVVAVVRRVNAARDIAWWSTRVPLLSAAISTYKYKTRTVRTRHGRGSFSVFCNPTQPNPWLYRPNPTHDLCSHSWPNPTSNSNMQFKSAT